MTINRTALKGALALMLTTGALGASPLMATPAMDDTGSRAQSQDPATETARQAWQWIQQGAVVIDVRTDAEFAAGHLEGAHHLPYDRIGELIPALGLSPDQPIVVYCRSGRRSGIALATLEAMGYRQVHNGGGLETLQAVQP